MDLMKMYEENQDFKEYVDKIMIKHNYDLERALEFSIVKEFAE